MVAHHDLAGFTGRLVTKQLNNHREHASFTFALAARSRAKLVALAAELDLNAQTSLLTLDVTKTNEVEEIVRTAKVVINTVGPYWLFGTPVVRYVRPERCSAILNDVLCRACARNGIHYVDLSGPQPI
jgi:short subunit dehydrogenase-like uncharacterized protein